MKTIAIGARVRYWYNFATIREIGEHASYTRQREECAAALAAVA